ncbi:uncharacterized protein LOC135155767 [Lytechinus pictus]|uniref:uncharacterized protein LOC135155767 n=1 Tax=Lytechinus pictus TaxID=7653 RepID=UPI0030B9B171
MTHDFMKSKCVFNTDRVVYFGHVFTANGISPDPRKVEAIHAVAEPQNVSEIRSFLGMVTYCARFIPDLASISAPLRELTRADVPWSWGPPQAAAFQRIKDLVLSTVPWDTSTQHTLMSRCNNIKLHYTTYPPKYICLVQFNIQF